MLPLYARIFHHFMNSPLLSIKVSFWWCMMFTLPTRIFSSFTYWTFLVIYTHIAQKDIPSIYELTLCADLDFLLSLLDTHIAHKKKFSHSWSDPLCLSRLTFVVDWYSHCPKDISFFHEVVFCAHIDFLLVLLDTHITHKDNSFMNWPSVHEISRK